ncbi:MAG: putative lipid II flippase FtsW [Candidatus Gastranaerophilaceae bacterium]|jgi:cell division protein FtsW
MYTEKRSSARSQRIRKFYHGKVKNIVIAPVDSGLLGIIIFLTVFGTLAVFSAAAPEGLRLFNNPFYFTVKHLVFVAIGVLLLVFSSRIDYKKWKDWSGPLAAVVIFLIAATLIPGLGKTEYGSSRWLTFLPIQPSELAKIACVVLGSKALSEAKTLWNDKIILNFGLIAVMMLIIILQPNLSIFLLLGLTCVAMLLAGGMTPVPVITAIICTLPILAYKILSTPYQLKRVTGWLNPFEDPQGTGYNLIQSWYAIASGGLFGVGFGNSKQKLFWLPFGHTDFIFSVIAEELGFIGCVILIGFFIALVNKGFQISRRCPDSFGKLLAFGITFIIAVQAFINMGVATGVLPVTGVTLPLISYGGTSVMVTMVMLGILLNISRKRIKRIMPNERQ